MTTVSEKIRNDADRPLQEAFRSADDDLMTKLQDMLSDTMHALELVANNEGANDPRAGVLVAVQRATGHYWSESVWAIEHGDEDADSMGGIPIYQTEVDFPHLRTF